MTELSLVNVGSQPGDKTGDTLRVAFQKLNASLQALDLSLSMHPHQLADIEGAGTAAAASISDFASALQGSKADTAYQPGTNLDLDGARLNRPTFGAAQSAFASPAIVDGVLTLTPMVDHWFLVELTENVTSIVIEGEIPSGVGVYLNLHLLQDGTGGRTVAWPESFVWNLGQPVTVAPGAGQRTCIAAESEDGGESWIAWLHWISALPTP